MFFFLFFKLKNSCSGIFISIYFRCRYVEGRWIPSGKAERPPSNAIYVHNESPNFGAHWMKEPVNFSKLKLSNKKSEPGMVRIKFGFYYYCYREFAKKEGEGGTNQFSKWMPIACLEKEINNGKRRELKGWVLCGIAWWLPWYFVTLLAFDRCRPWSSVGTSIPTSSHTRVSWYSLADWHS